MKRIRYPSMDVMVGRAVPDNPAQLAFTVAVAIWIALMIASGMPLASAAGIRNVLASAHELKQDTLGCLPQRELVANARQSGGRGPLTICRPGAAPEFRAFRRSSGYELLQPRPVIADHAELSGPNVGLPGREHHSTAPAVADCAAFQLALPCGCSGALVSKDRFKVAADGVVVLLHARAPPCG